MDLYTETSYRLSKELTLRYSTSFSKSTQLFSKDIQPHIFAIYGLVRIADEIVDTYTGRDKAALLNDLEAHTYETIKSGYSTNPIVHAFVQTARQFGITQRLIAPFFESMRLDLSPQVYDDKLFKTYIYGSAEVIGLMCLRVFVAGDKTQYAELKHGARALGAAYQKVNFLRDIASDYAERGRVYFPGVTFENFNDQQKAAIIADMKNDFAIAHQSIKQLPHNAQKAVRLSYEYYRELLHKLEITPAEQIKAKRVRVNGAKKLVLLAKVNVAHKKGTKKEAPRG